MLDLQMPWQRVPRPHEPNRHWRRLATVLGASLPLSVDPSPSLLHPGADASHTAREVRIPIGDHTTTGWFFVPRHATGGTVCLVHGTTAEKPGSYFLWIRGLLEAGLQVLTFELDGHGDNPRVLSCPGLDDNVPAALAFLRDQPEVDPDRIGLLGISLGGACALNTARREPGIKAVVTIATPYRLKIDDWGRLHELAGLLSPEVFPIVLEATPDRLFSFMTAPMRVSGAADLPHEETDLLNPVTLDTVNRALRYLNPLDSASELGQTPLLVINGEWDNICPPWQAQELYERASGPKAFVRVPRRNHFTIIVSRRAIGSAVSWFRRWL